MSEVHALDSDAKFSAVQSLVACDRIKVGFVATCLEARCPVFLAYPKSSAHNAIIALIEAIDRSRNGYVD